MKWLSGIAALLFTAAPAFGAATLDVSTAYKLRALDYRNVLLSDDKSNKSFISQNARLGFAVKNIELEGGGGEPATLDVALALRAIGIAGSTGAVPVPFNAAASYYPNAQFLPFIENAYVRAHGLLGAPIELTVGQQPYEVGSGLLLADDGAGLPGISGVGTLPWWDIKLSGYVFQPRNNQQLANSLTTFGLGVAVPSEGTWEFNQMFEREHNDTFELGNEISKAFRSFSSARYMISFGPLYFDGEAALERGSATPTGPTPLGNHITYKGDAEVMRAKWKQPLPRGEEGIARITVARGSGDDANTGSTDEAFFPSHGHRFDGLERAGFGEFFGATPYDAFAGHSTSTVSGLPQGASGIVTVGLGFTPPSYHGITLDADYWLYQADRSIGPARTLGNETDFRLRYGFRDRFNISGSVALFRSGPAISDTKPSARRYMLEVSGRF